MLNHYCSSIFFLDDKLQCMPLMGRWNVCACQLQAERARLEGALQEAAFLRGRMEAMGAANALQSMQQPQVPALPMLSVIQF